MYKAAEDKVVKEPVGVLGEGAIAFGGGAVFNKQVCMTTCVYARTYVHTHTYMHARTNTQHTHTHTHTHTHGIASTTAMLMGSYLTVAVAEIIVFYTCAADLILSPHRLP